MKRSRVCLLFLIASFAVAEQSAGPVQFEMKRRPSMEMGDWLKMDFRVKVQTDFRGFSPNFDTEEGLFDPRRLRTGVQGRLFKDLEFELEYELLPRDYQLRDGFLNYRRVRELQLQAGKFKIPFGLDQLTGPSNLDFVYRSRIGSQLAPGRDTGLMLHGELLEKGLHYQAGVFRHDGEIAEAAGNERTGGRTLAARLTANPAEFFGVSKFFRNLQLGAAFTRSDVSEGANSLRGRTVARDTFQPRMYVNGIRFRQGAELLWQAGSLRLQGEYMTVREQRRGQSLMGGDLPDLMARGWYLSATHPLVGKRPSRNLDAGIRSVFPGFQAGLLEAAARYEQIRFASRAAGFAPSRSPRATNVFPNSERALTLGVNWHASRYTKFQFNVIRDVLEDAFRTPIPGTQRYWVLVGRVQFVL